MEEAVAGSDGRENEESEAGSFGSFIDGEGVERERVRARSERNHAERRGAQERKRYSNIQVIEGG